MTTRPVRPSEETSLGSYRSDLASWIEAHVADSLAAAASMPDAQLNEAAISLGALRKEIVAELRADGAQAENFAAVLASVEKLHDAEKSHQTALQKRIEAAASLEALGVDSVSIIIPGTDKVVTSPVANSGIVETSSVAADGTEKNTAAVSPAVIERLAEVRQGLGSGLAASTTPVPVEAELVDDEEDDPADLLPQARITASISFHGHNNVPVPFGSEIDVEDIAPAMQAALSAAQGLATGARQTACTIDKYAHIPRERMLTLTASAGQVSNDNGALIEEYKAQHLATRQLRAAINANPSAGRFSEVTSLKAAANLCVQGRINYDIKQCATRGRPFTDCVFTDVPSDRGSLTQYYGRNFDRTAVPAGITTDCPDGTPSNKTCVTITHCAMPQTVTLCAQAVCIKVGVFSKMNHPENLRNEIHLVNVASDVVAEVKALTWIRNQSLIQVASPFYGSTTTVYAALVRSTIGVISNLRMAGFEFDLAMPWWLPYHMLINESAAGDDGRDWNTAADVMAWLESAVPGVGNVCTFIDSASTGPSQTWAAPAAGPVPAFPATPEIYLIPQGMAGRITAPGIDMGGTLEEAKMFSDDDRTGNVLSMFSEEFFGFSKMHDCGRAIVLQFPGLCADGTYAPENVAAVCGSSV